MRALCCVKQNRALFATHPKHNTEIKLYILFAQAQTHSTLIVRKLYSDLNYVCHLREPIWERALGTYISIMIYLVFMVRKMNKIVCEKWEPKTVLVRLWCWQGEIFQLWILVWRDEPFVQVENSARFPYHSVLMMVSMLRRIKSLRSTYQECWNSIKPASNWQKWLCL